MFKRLHSKRKKEKQKRFHYMKYKFATESFCMSGVDMFTFTFSCTVKAEASSRSSFAQSMALLGHSPRCLSFPDNFPW